MGEEKRLARMAPEDVKRVRGFEAMADILAAQGDEQAERQVRISIFRIFNRAMISRMDAGETIAEEELLLFHDMYGLDDGLSIFDVEPVVVTMELRRSSPLYFDFVELLKRHQGV